MYLRSSAFPKGIGPRGSEIIDDVIISLFFVGVDNCRACGDIRIYTVEGFVCGVVNVEGFYFDRFSHKFGYSFHDDLKLVADLCVIWIFEIWKDSFSLGFICPRIDVVAHVYPVINRFPSDFDGD